MNIAVIGLGAIGRRHAENFRTLGCAVMAWDRDPSMRAGISCAESIEDALAGRDGVVIATPPDSHVDLGLAALRAGAHVLIEKPLAIDVAGGEALRDAAALHHRTLLVGYPWRHWPPLQYIKQQLDNGEIGRVLSVSTIYGYHLNRHGPHATRPESFLRDRKRGGGCLPDTSHAIDYLLWICGEIVEIAGVVETRHLAIAADDCADLVVRFKSGVVGHVRLSLWLPEVTSSLEILGETGTITWDRHTGARLNGAGGVYVAPGDINGVYLFEAAHFLACIRSETSPVCTGSDGIQTLRVIAAARQASAERRWVNIQ